MNLPNRLTILRIFMVPLMVVLVLAPWKNGDLWAAAVFAVASFTDFLDGWLARRNHQVSNFGKFMDPLADKMLVLSAMIALVAQGRLPSWVVIVIACRDLAVDGLRLLAAERGVVIAASRPAKMKTGVQMLMVIALLLAGHIIAPLYQALCSGLVGLALVLTLYSGIEYLYRGREFFR